jgi:hypothetical protein
MKNSSISDAVAMAMDSIVKSASHKALFGKMADVNSAHDKCSKCGSTSCSCGDSMSADDNDARKKKMEPKEKSSDDSSSADDQDARREAKSDESSADAPVKFDPNFGAKPVVGPVMHADDSSSADDNDARSNAKSSDDESSADDMEVDAGFDVAIDSLLTASAALDAVGMEKSSAFSLKIASLVVEAKKKEKDKKKSKSKSDSQSAKDKKKKMDDKKKFDLMKMKKKKEESSKSSDKSKKK